MGAFGTGILKWWIYASFAVHTNMRGHTSRGLSMGRRFPVVTSTKQNLNTWRSTEADIVRVDDFMPEVCWTRCLLEAWDYNDTENIVYQDNQSDILLEKNVKASGRKRTKHINVRLFFVKDHINKK